VHWYNLLYNVQKCRSDILDFVPPDSCIDQDDNELLAGSVWQKDVCTECTCIQGKESCFTETCSIGDTCPNGMTPIKAEGHCCMVCPVDKFTKSDETEEYIAVIIFF